MHQTSTNAIRKIETRLKKETKKRKQMKHRYFKWQMIASYMTHNTNNNRI